MQNQEPCGAHQLGDAIPGSYFDYTCDDCMLPEPHLDPEEINQIEDMEIEQDEQI